ncbi:MAG: type II CRISPR RNA-guided endonuclease Cas9 [Paludibacteraceae bacterium]|nr:type II CRISPR RNA-guided endonuclease Cas9 [Paludibacteraceae bacterium]
MKKILGLDLGTNSIGWAVVNEAENADEKSSIVKLGVRVNPLTVDELSNFEKGKSITTNADRTLKRTARRNLQRYKLRRECLINILKENGFVADDTILSENGNRTTFETYRLRAKAATEEISLKEFARILLMINKKRGYKSSRKAKSTDEGQLIDGMEIAKRLYEENLTPGQLSLTLLEEGKKHLPDFYRSDLQSEFDRVWDFQKQFYDFLTDELKEELKGKNEKATWAICAPSKDTKDNGKFVWRWKVTEQKWNDEKAVNEEVEVEKTLEGEKRKGTSAEQNIENYKWRAKALSEKISPEQLIVVFKKINGQINSASSYLGDISDRSKELYFNKMTVGQFQMAQLDKNPNYSLKNQVFYRQDYLNEFEVIWETQAKFHKELTPELKKEIRDVVIFYQRPLKSQKGLISFCEFESRKIEVEVDGKKKIKTIGSRVCPKSSPLFQEFKIWQRLNDVLIFPANEKNKKKRPNARSLSAEEKLNLYYALSYKDELGKGQILDILDMPDYELNFDKIQGNTTQYKLFNAYKEIAEKIGYDKDKINSIEDIKAIFESYNIKTDILQLDDKIEWENFESQPLFKLWHLLYSFEGDKSDIGNKNLIEKISSLCNMPYDFAKILANVQYENAYASLSSKAIKKILPHLISGEQYDIACVLAGYKTHSKDSLTKEQIKNKQLKDRLELLPRNSLRNPVVEKILNQMVNVVNGIIDVYGKPEEVRIELARELKKNADERFMLTDSTNNSDKEIKRLKDEMKEKFPNVFGNYEPSRNDIIRYRLWLELAPNGHKPLYGSSENLKREISPAILFSGDIEIEHILPKARLFDDSFSNKTLAFKQDNLNKGAQTAIDFIGDNGLSDYIERIIRVYGTRTTKKVVTNSKTKNKKVEKETKTFDSIFREHEQKMLRNKNIASSVEKWNKATDEERQKLSKPWACMSDVEKKIEVINKYYSGKIKKLITKGSELPEGFINRDLANTQYITKKAKEKLGEIVRYVVCSTGSITDRLREDWQLVDIMRELNWKKYEELGLTEIIDKVDYDGNPYKVYRIKGWTKRNDHRHHAMDALTTAFTKRSIIQYLNNLNARRLDEKQSISNAEKDEFDSTAITTEDVILSTPDVKAIEKKELEVRENKNGKKKLCFKMPMDNFRAEAKRQLENTLISIKAKNKVVTRNINKAKNNVISEIIDKEGNKKTVKGQLTLTPRGQLHEDTVHGVIKRYAPEKVKINAHFGESKIKCVVDKRYKCALLDRFLKYEKDPKRAFAGKNSLDKNPVWLNESHTEKVPNEVVLFEFVYTKRKEVSYDNFGKSGNKKLDKEGVIKALNKIIDKKTRDILIKRFEEYGFDAQKAFSNLTENPIWLNQEKGIAIKRVTITGISNGEPLHDKRDKDGNLILDEKGIKQPVDYVNTGNNHHVAIYRKPKLDKNNQPVLDENGDIVYELDEEIVSFYAATSRAMQHLPIIDKTYKQSEGWEFLFSMKQNEYFVFPRYKMVKDEDGNEKQIKIFDPKEIDLLDPDNYALISPNLFRVQKMSKVLAGNSFVRDYVFRHHLETKVEEIKVLKDITYKQYKSLPFAVDIVKVRVNHIGQIVSVGEY